MDGVRRKALAGGLRRMGLDGDEGKIGKIERFLDEIDRWNPSYGLVAEGEDLVTRHVLDSLSGLPAIIGRNPRLLADVGSGAGFPGIPLAVWMDGTEFRLIERSGKRAGFLRNAVLTLGLKNVRIVEGPVEDVDAAAAGFDIVTFRAWTALDAAMIAAVAPLLAPGGVIAAYKGRRSVVDSELSSIAGLVDSVEILPLEIPETDDERHLVILEPKRGN